MKIATWNVNSLKVRLPQLLDWLATDAPELVCLQETKCEDVAFPLAALQAAGYEAVYCGQKTYNGVALLIRAGADRIPAAVQYGIPGLVDPQQRVIAATVAGMRVVCAYFPNGQAVGSDKFAYKLDWLAALEAWLAEEVARYPQLALAGDFNIAPDDRDVHDPAAWAGQILCSPEERSAFSRLLGLGLNDSFRLFDQPPQTFTWWDYRMLGFQKNRGLRIDHILLSAPLATRCRRVDIVRALRKQERPSDHAPVVVHLDPA